jgi:hypothetical protein
VTKELILASVSFHFERRGALAGLCDTGRAPAKDAVPDDGSRRAPKTQAATGTTRHPSTGTVNRALTPQNLRRTRRNK